jgi:hypothetical protein
MSSIWGDVFVVVARFRAAVVLRLWGHMSVFSSFGGKSLCVQYQEVSQPECKCNCNGQFWLFARVCQINRPLHSQIPRPIFQMTKSPLVVIVEEEKNHALRQGSSWYY